MDPRHVSKQELLYILTDEAWTPQGDHVGVRHVEKTTETSNICSSKLTSYLTPRK